MKFFVPASTKRTEEDEYQKISAAVKDQFGWKISDRRIYSLKYVHDRKRYHTAVGKTALPERKHQVVAILDSNLYMVVARSAKDKPSITILVNKDEVEGVEEFA